MSTLPRLCLGRCGNAIPAGSYCPRCTPTTSERGLGATHARHARACIARQPWCTYCGSTDDLTADHVTPRSLGGTAQSANLVTACRRCNSERGGKLGAKQRRRF